MELLPTINPTESQDFSAFTDLTLINEKQVAED